MNKKVGIGQQNGAVSTVVSAVLVIMIFGVVTSSILSWGIPYINEVEDSRALINIEMQFNAIAYGIEDITKDEFGGQKTLSISTSKGSLAMDKVAYDRIVFMYSYFDTISFTAKNLDTIGNNFILKILGNPFTNLVTAKAEWYLYNGSEETSKIDCSDQGLNEWAVSSDKIFTGTVEIDLYYKDAFSENKLLFGKIWILDSNSLIYTLYSGNKKNQFSLEKNAIIYTEDKTSQIEKALKISINGDSLDKITIRVVQTPALNSFSTGSNGFNSKIKMKSYYGLAIREKENAYALRLQMWGSNAEIWLKYLIDNYHFTDELSNTLLYQPSSSNMVQLNLLQALAEISID